MTVSGELREMAAVASSEALATSAPDSSAPGSAQGSSRKTSRRGHAYEQVCDDGLEDAPVQRTRVRLSGAGALGLAAVGSVIVTAATFSLCRSSRPHIGPVDAAAATGLSVVEPPAVGPAQFLASSQSQASSNSTALVTSETQASSPATTAAPATTSTTRGLPSLYCYMVVRVPSYEIELAQVMYEKKASIYACDGHRLFGNGGSFKVGGEMVKKMKSSQVGMGDWSKKGTATSSWLNVLIFVEAWQTLIDEGVVMKHDWTAKLDPDAVFFPDRLRVRLQPYFPPGDSRPLWVANCDRVWNNQPPTLKIFGSFEVFSSSALLAYNASSGDCMKNLPWKRWGEDLFMEQCMKMLKVGIVNGVSFLGDARCHYAPCSDQTKVTFHHFKSVGSWLSCWGQSHEAKPDVIFK
mmetsp:Transcript_44189/g.127646  ORF Transcript_44189/g.127646 Transcript_44189/m.127646 type:complete len:408 (+) Transcript_44189:72-1295(+)